MLWQKRAVQIISDKEWDEHFKPLFIKLKVMTVTNVYTYYTVLNIKTIIDITQKESVHKYKTRAN